MLKLLGKSEFVTVVLSLAIDSVRKDQVEGSKPEKVKHNLKDTKYGNLQKDTHYQ